MEKNGLIGKIHKFVLNILEDVLRELSISDIKDIVEEALRSYGADWQVEIKEIRW